MGGVSGREYGARPGPVGRVARRSGCVLRPIRPLTSRCRTLGSSFTLAADAKAAAATPSSWPPAQYPFSLALLLLALGHGERALLLDGAKAACDVQRRFAPAPLQLIKEGLLESVAGNPGLCVAFRLNLTDPALPLCPRPNLRRGLAWDVWVVGGCTVATLALARRWVLWARRLAEHEGALRPPSSKQMDWTAVVTSTTTVNSRDSRNNDGGWCGGGGFLARDGTMAASVRA
ncbi:unnamed protein product [Miscanthus lutarioriparius]|uniref:Uncharacterized protein n=1 Tax=Miscanthus lutarioriparius TaxID=422564 RepID=A0A811MZF0_9POAL|nr:unnamed protein product [Miscanthus lutarioriparius]